MTAPTARSALDIQVSAGEMSDGRVVITHATVVLDRAGADWLWGATFHTANVAVSADIRVVWRARDLSGDGPDAGLSLDRGISRDWSRPDGGAEEGGEGREDEDGTHLCG
jgi:hypothetical protein